MNDDQPTRRVEFSVRRMLGEIEEFARRQPVTASAAGFGVGLLLNLLPARVVAGTVTAVGATLMRPVLLSLGVIKAIEICCQKPQITSISERSS